jgi:tetratricopeptide (TPR) repeat protein
MKRLLFLACLMMMIKTVAGQELQNRIDSLRNELPAAKADSARLRLHSQLAQIYMKAGLTDSQLVYADRALFYAEQLQPLPESLIKYQATALRMKGIYYRIGGNYMKAVDYYLAALRSFEQMNDTAGIASTNNSIGITYLSIDRFREAHEYFLNAYRLDSLLQKPERMLSDLVNLSYALHAEGAGTQEQYRQALNYSYRAVKLADEAGDPYLQVSANEAVSLSLYHLKRFEEAEKYQQRALDRATVINQPGLIAEQQTLLSQIWTETGRAAEAIELSKQAEKLMLEHSLAMLYEDVYGGLSHAYVKLGDYKRAYEYLMKQQEVHDSMYQTKIAEQIKLYEGERKDHKIELLQVQNLITQTKLQRNRAWVIGLIASLLLLGLLLYLLYRNRQEKMRHITTLRRLNGELQQQKDEVSRMNTVLELKALRAQMNPHFIFNCMSSIQECMLTGRTETANTYLTKLSKLLRLVLLHADDENISLEKELGMLKLYLDLEALRLRDGFKYEIKVDEEIFAEEVQVPTLILQPFAENAIWHGLLNLPKNRELKIAIAASGDTLDCVVEDNGIGREKAQEIESGSKKHQSKGLELIERRLNILREKTQQVKTGVTFTDLKNSLHESAGTRVNITLPLVEI